MNLRALTLAVAGCVALAGAEAVQEFQLPNGLRILLVENHERPLVRLELRTAWDASEEPRGKEGVGGYLGDMLRTSGAGLLKRDAFQRFIEDRALGFTFAMTPRAFAWSVLSDSQGQDDAFESLAMAATRPNLDGPVAEARRQGYIKAFKARTPRDRAEALFLRRIGGPSSLTLPEEGSLNRIEYQDLVQLSRRVLRPEKSVLVIYGDINLPQAKQLSMLHLGAWGPSPEKALLPAKPIPDPPSPTRTWVVPETGRTVQIRVGASARDSVLLPRTALRACAWLAKRELQSGLPPLFEQTDFQISPEGTWLIKGVASPGRSAPEALDAIQKLLKRLQGDAFGTTDLAAARSIWNAERGNRGLHPQEETAFLADRALRSTRLGEEEEFSAERLQAALRQLFAAEACSYFIQGEVPQEDAWLVKAGLGPVETVR